MLGQVMHVRMYLNRVISWPAKVKSETKVPYFLYKCFFSNPNPLICLGTYSLRYIILFIKIIKLYVLVVRTYALAHFLLVFIIQQQRNRGHSLLCPLPNYTSIVETAYSSIPPEALVVKSVRFMCPETLIGYRKSICWLLGGSLNQPET